MKTRLLLSALLTSIVMAVWFIPAAFASECRGDCAAPGPYDKGIGNHGHPHEHSTNFNGWYTGGGLGISDSSYTTSQLRWHPEREEITSHDEEELAFRIFAGKADLANFLDNRLRIGAELGYANLGDIIGNQEVDAIDLTATARYRIGSSWDILGRVGAAYWDADDDGTDAVVGLGLTKTINALRLRLEYATYADVEGEDIDTLMLSASHRF